MGNYTKNKGKEGSKRYVMLEHYLLNSAAYRSLSFRSRALYTEFKRRYRGDNNGYVHMAVRSAAKELGCAENTASKAIAELADKGFIKYRFKGKFSHRVHQASEFILTEYEYNGQRATKEFMKWKPE